MAPVRVGVITDSALAGKGLAVVLSEAGLEVCADTADAEVLVVAYRRGRIAEAVAAVGATDLPRVAVIESGGQPAEVFRLLQAGFTTVVNEDNVEKTLPTAVSLAGDGYGVLDSSLLSSMAAMTSTGLPIAEREIEILRLLHSGLTVADVAHRVGYSERALYRILSSAFQQIGVDSRQGAFDWLREQNLL